MDMLETGNYAQAAHANGKQGTMSAAEYKTEFSMWAILASPLVVTTPILNCSKTDQIAANFTPGRRDLPPDLPRPPPDPPSPDLPRPRLRVRFRELASARYVPPPPGASRR